LLDADADTAQALLQISGTDVYIQLSSSIRKEEKGKKRRAYLPASQNKRTKDKRPVFLWCFVFLGSKPWPHAKNTPKTRLLVTYCRLQDLN
jgi:hypothetical protein